MGAIWCGVGIAPTRYVGLSTGMRGLWLVAGLAVACGGEAGDGGGSSDGGDGSTGAASSTGDPVGDDIDRLTRELQG